METAKRLQDNRRHATVECIPVPPKVAAKAPLYFKKSIDDAASEWAQHHAKRWIDTTAKVTNPFMHAWSRGLFLQLACPVAARLCSDRCGWNRCTLID